MYLVELKSFNNITCLNNKLGNGNYCKPEVCSEISLYFLLNQQTKIKDDENGRKKE
jgi:hypothetical protein